jgi:hypothetical protein
VRIPACTSLLLILIVSACGDDGPELLVDVRTDYVAGEEFVAVRTTLDSGRELSTPALFGQDFLGGVRVADYDGVFGERVLLTTTLVTVRGEEVVARGTRVTLSGQSTGVTVLISRSCEGVLCPGPGDDPAFEACFGGRCVEPACSAENASACGDPECTSDGECTSPVGCAIGRCVAGSCLVGGDDSACGGGEFCDPLNGCRLRGSAAPVVDASVDSSR